MQYSVAIADDHTLIAKALATIINVHPMYKVIYEVENGIALQERFKNKKNIPDILLLDISMPIMDGFETALWLKENHPEVLVMVLSMQDDDSSLIRMIKNGAKGYMLKNSQPSELIHALDELIKKGMYFPEWISSRVLMNLSNDLSNIQSKVNLSEREVEFIKLACSEMTYKEIAGEMFCSPRTVEGYRDSVFEKLDIKTRVGIVMFAIKHKLVEL